ncbi:tRNA (adenine(58)-N(1))-methyltransferase, mitochondrial [Archocentrus centrarchus]|uniref:tRNA (adenine(58)-N(1))-methyltransferase, mitochondrial n=1 Tax=Archocentrus centrarchus TaxID=63155 RepID=UPI0011E9B956|nr:tRNA (adenine(58)-N(1))-methyltransferase, mitochondrial [Archocentrus centrarchus]
MALKVVLLRLMFTHRMMSVCASSRRHSRHRDLLVKLNERVRDSRTFSAASVKCNEDKEGTSDYSRLSTKLTSRRRRPLSPLERISRLLPEDTLSPEVMQLREQEPDKGADIQGSVTNDTQVEGVDEEIEKKAELPAETPSPLVGAEEPDTLSAHHREEQLWPTLPGERLLTCGELLVAEYRKKRWSEFRKMFQLQTGARLPSNWGVILHNDIAGQPAGQFLKTNRGVPIFIRRASLEDYVLFMKRGPAIAYPKDAASMLMMMDVTEGDCVLESGSGSGAMSLFLSRAVGSKGSVLSVEVREDHYRRAKLNYKHWRTAWSLRRGEEWPDNVQFHNADLCTASSLLAGRGFHAVALDLINPHLVLPTVIPHLHPGAVCTIYLANITQVTDLLEGIRCSALPLLCERIIELPLREWVVAPALQKNGQYCNRKAQMLDENPSQEAEASDESDKDELTTEESANPAFGSIPYIARPHPEQMSHTAFLVKLRKCVQ